MTKSHRDKNTKPDPGKKCLPGKSVDEALLISILDSIAEGICITDQNYNIRYINKALQHRFGHFQGQKCYQYFHKRDKPCPTCNHEAVFLKGETVSSELYTEGTGNTYELTSMPIYQPDNTILMVTLFNNITQQKLLEEKNQSYSIMRKQNEEQLAFQSKILGEIGDVVIAVDTEERINYWNKAAKLQYGFRSEEVLGKKLSEVIRYQWISPNDEQISRSSLLKKGCWTGFNIHSRKSGEKIYVRSSISLLKDDSGNPIGIIAVARDNTERKSIQDALRNSERRYRYMVENSPDVILILDAQAHVVDCNSAGLKLFGYTAGQIKGQHLTKLVPAANKKMLQIFSLENADQGIFEDEFEVISSEGKQITVWAKITALVDTDKRVNQIIMHLRDITERRKAEELKDEFISFVSHELRTPLTIIVAALNTMVTEKERLQKDEVTQLLDYATQEAESLSQLLANLIELSRYQAKRLVLNTEKFNLKISIKKIISKLNAIYPSHRFITRASTTLPLLTADPIRVERILFNLLENAAKYSPADSKVMIRCNMTDDRIKVSVTDQGKGISQQDQARLFLPFERLDQIQHASSKGLGIGLLVCRRLVEAHGGHIWVESSNDKGSKFSFTLPLNKNITGNTIIAEQSE